MFATATLVPVQTIADALAAIDGERYRPLGGRPLVVTATTQPTQVDHFDGITWQLFVMPCGTFLSVQRADELRDWHEIT